MSTVSYIWLARSEISIPQVMLFCLTPISNSIKSDKMEAESKSASQHSKIFFFVNIKTISTKEVNLSTKLHMNILKGLSKTLKFLSVWYWKEESLIFQSCKSIMVAQKKPIGRNILHFSTFTNPKSK